METLRRRSHKGGPDKIYTHALECASLQKSAKFDLTKEDPAVYANEDLVGYNPGREWDTPLPKVTASTSQNIQPVTIPEEVIEKAKSQHDVLVRWLKTAGIDLCRNMEDVEHQHELERVQAKQKICNICQKTCFNTQRLRAHIRSQHMSVTPYHCSICKRYFGDKNTLKLHNRKHDPEATKYVCPTCNKEFLQKGKLNEHLKVHDPTQNQLVCRYLCGKECNEKKNMVAHEKYCELNPNRPPPSQCPYCSKKFLRLKDLKKHAKTSHTSRFSTLMKDMGLE